MMEKIELVIKSVEDRRSIAGILTINGYRVWIERQKHKSAWVTVLCAEKGDGEGA